MKIIAKITDIRTGNVHDYDASDSVLADSSPNIWIWSDGNYSCDCNLHRFFTGKDEDVSCETMFYQVELVVDGVVVFSTIGNWTLDDAINDAKKFNVA